MMSAEFFPENVADTVVRDNIYDFDCYIIAFSDRYIDSCLVDRICSLLDIPWIALR